MVSRPDLRSLAPIIVGLAAALAAAGCGNQDQSVAEPEATTPQETTTTSSSQPVEPEPVDDSDEPAPNNIAAWDDNVDELLQPVDESDLWIVSGAGQPDAGNRGFLVNLGGCLGLIWAPGAPPVPLMLGDPQTQGTVDILDNGHTIEMNGNAVPLGTFIDIGGAYHDDISRVDAIPAGCPVEATGAYIEGSPSKVSLLREYNPERDGQVTNDN